MVTVSVLYLCSFLYPQPLITPGLLPLSKLFLCFAPTTLFTLSLFLSPSPVPLLAFLFRLVPKVSSPRSPPCTWAVKVPEAPGCPPAFPAQLLLKVSQA